MTMEGKGMWNALPEARDLLGAPLGACGEGVSSRERQSHVNRRAAPAQPDSSIAQRRPHVLHKVVYKLCVITSISFSCTML